MIKRPRVRQGLPEFDARNIEDGNVALRSAVFSIGALPDSAKQRKLLEKAKRLNDEWVALVEECHGVG